MRRIAVAGAAALALIVSFTVWAGGTDSACTLDQVTNATGQVDTLTGVAPFGDGALVVGTRFAGSVGGAMEATATADGTYDAHQLDVFGGHVVQLDDVTTDGSQAWAVGSLSDLAPAAVRWDGSSSSAMAIADPGPGEDGLAGVASDGSGELWAVGRHQIGANYVPLIERSDGSSWQPVTSPHAGASSQMKDVATAANGDAWAVGWSVTGQVFHPLAMRLVGSTWTIVDTPSLDDGGVFTGVAAEGPANVWAVGWTGRGDDVRPLVERWNGHRWTVVSSPGGRGSSLLSVAVTPTGIVVAGRQTDEHGQPGSLVAFRSDETWMPASVPAAGASWITGIAIDRDGRTWAVGSSFPSNAVVTGLVVSGCVES